VLHDRRGNGQTSGLSGKQENRSLATKRTQRTFQNRKDTALEMGYASRFQSVAAARHYESVVYCADGYDSFMWSIERHRLLAIVHHLKHRYGKLKHLDFACGTGRILAALERHTSSSMGLDISSEMAELARGRVHSATVWVGDVLSDPTVADTDYDIITAFRFFCNAEPRLRASIMQSLSVRLKDNSGRLVFNIHGNKHSLRHFAIEHRRRRGEEHSEMSLGEVKQLLHAAGLEIETWCGVGICPEFLHRGRMRNLARFIDSLSARWSWVRPICIDLLFVAKPSQPDDRSA
jgi:SAM-dependent methyltransferase